MCLLMQRGPGLKEIKKLEVMDPAKAELLDKIKAQGDVVRKLKAEKADKSMVRFQNQGQELGISLLFMSGHFMACQQPSSS